MAGFSDQRFQVGNQLSSPWSIIRTVPVRQIGRLNRPKSDWRRDCIDQYRNQFSNRARFFRFLLYPIALD